MEGAQGIHFSWWHEHHLLLSSLLCMPHLHLIIPPTFIERKTELLWLIIPPLQLLHLFLHFLFLLQLPPISFSILGNRHLLLWGSFRVDRLVHIPGRDRVFDGGGSGIFAYWWDGGDTAYTRVIEVIDYFEHAFHVQDFFSLFHVKVLLLDTVYPHLNDLQKRRDKGSLWNDSIGMRLRQIKVLVDPKFAGTLFVEANAGIIKHVELNMTFWQYFIPFEDAFDDIHAIWEWKLTQVA